MLLLCNGGAAVRGFIQVIGDRCQGLHPGNGMKAVRRFIRVMGDSCRVLLLGNGGAAVSC